MPKYIVKVNLDSRRIISIKRHRGSWDDKEGIIAPSTYLVEANCKKKVGKKVDMFATLENKAVQSVRKQDAVKKTSAYLDTEVQNLSIQK